MDESLRCEGPGCDQTLTRAATGRPAKFCGPNCRKAAQRQRDRAAEAERQHARQLAEARATAAGVWRPLEETAHEVGEIAGAVFAYAAGGNRADLAGKLREFRLAAGQLEVLAVTYSDASARAAQLAGEASPDD